MGKDSNKKYYFLYQTVNKVNGKTYIGVHGTNNMNDGYIGCGIYRQSDADREHYKKGSNSQFIRAVVKYGYDSFERYELDFFDSLGDAMNEERVIVNQQWVKSKDNYNSCGGGMGRRFNVLSESHQNKLIQIHSSDYVVCDVVDGKTYFVNNIHEFCRNNNVGNAVCLFSVMNGRLVLYKKRYWACKAEDWKGYPDVRKKVNKQIPFKSYIVKIQSPDGLIHDVDNVSKFCKDNALDPSSMYKLAKGKIEDYKGYKIIGKV